MEYKDKIEMMEINNEIGVLSMSKDEEFLSHSSRNPDKLSFVKTDNAFTRKARMLQAIRRFQSGAPCGSIEKKGVTYFHPNLAKDGEQTGCNFLHREIFEYAKSRVVNKKSYETIEEGRLYNNFLSSQPMAFNLFFPLIKIVECEQGQIKLAEVVTKLLNVNKELHIERITEVGLEFIPEYYKDCLNDKTAMDAYMRYSTKDGKIGIIAIETKYTDILGKNQASNPSLAINTATERPGISSLFTSEAKDQINDGDIELSQVYRNFLLTETVRLHEDLDDSISIVLAPMDNDNNKEDENQLIKALNADYTYKFQVISLEDFVSVLIDVFPEESIFKQFLHRYLDFRPAEWMLQKLLKRNK